MEFSIVIPTYNREAELDRCLNSIIDQSLIPNEIIIVDDGDLSNLFLQNTKERLTTKYINFVYYKKNHALEGRGSSESRNIAIKIIKNPIFFILDDDIKLEGNFLIEIMHIWEYNRDVNLIGVGGVIKNNRKKYILEKIYNNIFGLCSEYIWDINKIGFQVWDDHIRSIARGYYMHGGASSYNTQLIKELNGFNTFSGGRTALEDVDFCLRAKNKGLHFIISPKASCIHEHSQTSRENDYLSGFKESYNRKIIFKQNCKINTWRLICFYWANIGWILRQFLTNRFKKGNGMLNGLFAKNIEKIK